MEVKIIDQKENKLLNRLEIVAIVNHPKEATPKREEIRKRIAAIMGKNPDLVVIRKILSFFGWPKSKVLANIYENKEDLLKLEPKYILKRNSIIKE